MVVIKKFERLPSTIVPNHYQLSFRPFLNKFTFDGSAVIDIDVISACSTIELNCAELQLHGVSFVTGEEYISPMHVIAVEDDETIKIEFDNPLPVGAAQLKFTFEGQLNDKMKGFHRNRYINEAGKEMYAASTQFEACNARYAFPCWDEPAVKATFDVTLVVPENLVALSNMPAVSESPHVAEGWKVVQYDRSPKMSTYLLAFVIGEYDFVEAKDSDGVLIRCYTPRGKKELGKFALGMAVKTLPFYNKYFSIPYPLPKLDMVAISEFSSGAMENWGLVTYRESCLLVDEESSSSATKQQVAIVVGHELAHQWFGNLVTMEWWTHLWLNEGFASWIENVSVDYCFPAFEIWTQFGATTFSQALQLDGLHSSHPVEVPVGHPSEVDEIFDDISYLKGSSIIRMLHDYIGDEKFRAGMAVYLTRHKYKNAQTSDLWTALGEACEEPIRDIMGTWTEQVGYPVVSAQVDSWGQKKNLILSQKRFCADGSIDENDQSWIIPIGICCSNSPKEPIKKVLMKGPAMVVAIDEVKDSEWIKINAGSVSFFRSNYDKSMQASLLNGIKKGEMLPNDRLGLLDDSFALARSGEIPTTEALKMAAAFTGEISFTVWSNLSVKLSTVALLMESVGISFDSYMLDIYLPIFSKLTWNPKEGESPLDVMLRGIIISKLGKHGHKEIIEESFKRFSAHVSGAAPIAADNRAAVYSIVLSHGGVAEFDALIKLYENSDLDEEKSRILRCIGCSNNVELIRKALDYSISDKVKSQNSVFAISSPCSSIVGRAEAWKFIQANWDLLYSRYKGFLLSLLIEGVLHQFTTQAELDSINKFFEGKDKTGMVRSLGIVKESITLNIKQLERDSKLVKRLLASGRYL